MLFLRVLHEMLQTGGCQYNLKAFNHREKSESYSFQMGTRLYRVSTLLGVGGWGGGGAGYKHQVTVTTLHTVSKERPMIFFPPVNTKDTSPQTL